mmetsp:Transcript_33111/g.83775  ORF Transcript_33111/g.83775 Transcript_33111/m.83775 type:complete len:300 (-) Transcript_33111:272-1171(-)
MALVAKRLCDTLSGRQEARIIMHGLDAAGKTTTLYRMKHGEAVTTIPTIGFNMETITYKNMDFATWDVGGRDKLRALWKHYYPELRGLVFVVDSNDRDRIQDAASELQAFLDEVQNVPVLVFANKQDLPNAMSGMEVTEKLGLHTLPLPREWYVQESCATTGDGLWEGLDWLYESIHLRRAVRKGGQGPSGCKLPEFLLPQSWLSVLPTVGAAFKGPAHQTASPGGSGLLGYADEQPRSQALQTERMANIARDERVLTADGQNMQHVQQAPSRAGEPTSAPPETLGDPQDELLMSVFGS